MHNGPVWLFVKIEQNLWSIHDLCSDKTQEQDHLLREKHNSGFLNNGLSSQERCYIARQSITYMGEKYMGSDVRCECCSNCESNGQKYR